MRRIMYLMLAFTFVFAVSTAVSALELHTVQRAIEQSGARWNAGPANSNNPMRTGLLQQEKAYPEAALKASRLATPRLLPSHFDWRNVNGRNYVTPVRNQGKCGSCWAFAVVGALESLALITLDNPDADLNLSEQTLVSCAAAGSCEGGLLDEAVEHLRKSGVPSEDCYPYREHNSACGLICDGGLGFYSSYGIKDWVNLTTGSAPNLQALKALLVTLGPLSVSYLLFEDFYYYEGGIYSYVEGDVQGGHAVLLVGYDDREEYFILKNSWGAEWGEDGYFRIAYSETTSKVKFAREVYGLLGLTAPENRVYPEITANGKRNLAASVEDTISIAVSLNPVNQPQAENLDWWIWMKGPEGTFWYDPASGQWETQAVSLKLPLFHLGQHVIWEGTLEPGKYTFNFAIDENQNDIFDGAWQESASVVIKEED